MFERLPETGIPHVQVTGNLLYRKTLVDVFADHNTPPLNLIILLAVMALLPHYRMHMAKDMKQYADQNMLRTQLFFPGIINHFLKDQQL